MADDRVCCVLPDPDEPRRGLALYGRAAPATADGFASSTTSGRRGGRGAIDVPDEVLETVRDRLESQKRVVFRVEVERVRELGRPAA